MWRGSCMMIRLSARGVAAPSICKVSSTARHSGWIQHVSFISSSHSRRTVIRPFTTKNTNEADTSKVSTLPESVGFLDQVVNKLNDSIKKHPAETLAVLFASDIASIGAMYGVLIMSGIEFSPEFALAFAASRPFRRFRLPLDLAVAAGVAKMFPVFSRVRLSDLAGALPNRPVVDPTAVSNASLMSRTMAMAKDVIDNYGAAYMMGSRLAGVSVVCALYFLIKQGVDVMPLLAKLGVEDVGTALGSYAAAVVFSSAFYPVTLGVTGYIVPAVAKCFFNCLTHKRSHNRKMAPSKKRYILERKDGKTVYMSSCACINRPNSSGICELNLWHGTTIDEGAVQTGKRLLRPQLPVIKYREWSLCGLSTGCLYHLVILSWFPLLSLFATIYIAIVGIFALLFAWCDATTLSESDPGARNYFNLSLQTLSAIGYGLLYPRGTCSNWITVIESFISMLLTSFITGVTFVKFARPRPHVSFSKVFTVSKREDGELEIKFRTVNSVHRHTITTGEILDVNFSLTLIRVEDTKTGEKKLCYYDLHLKSTSFISLRLEAELIHRIGPSSPFYGQTCSDIMNSDFVLILMMSGVDENLHDTIHKQYEYGFKDMRWGAKYTPMLDWDDNRKCLTVDLSKISEVEPAPIDPEDCSLIQVDFLSAAVQLEAKKKEDISVDDASDDEESIEIVGLDHGNSNANDKLEHAPASIDDNDTQSLEFQHDDDDNDDESKSMVSTQTNSGSDDGERYYAPPVRHIRFDERSRTTSLRAPRFNHQMHNHAIVANGHELPASVARRRVRYKNHPFSRFSTGLYYKALESSWILLFFWLVVTYFASIAVIALLLYLSPGKALQMTVDTHVYSDYARLFFFCGQTLSAVGYGMFSPNPDSNTVNFFVFVLVSTGTMVSTVLTGITWAKFSIPKPSILIYSDKLLLTNFHFSRVIMFRAANSRTYGTVIEGTFRMSVVILNHRLGRRETHELELVRNFWPIVQLGATLMHIIDENSPLYNMSTDELLSGNHFFVILFTGVDSVIYETIFSRKTYHSCDILVGHHFVDNIKLSTDGLHIDVEAIHETMICPEVDHRNSRLSNVPEHDTERPNHSPASNDNDVDVYEQCSPKTQYSAMS